MNVLETAESLGATKWAQYIRESGLAGELEAAGAYTLFAPTNEAFEVALKKKCHEPQIVFYGVLCGVTGSGFLTGGSESDVKGVRVVAI